MPPKRKKATPAAEPKRDSARRNGKAPKKHPRSPEQGRTGRTAGGYTPEKLLARAARRA